MPLRAEVITVSEREGLVNVNADNVSVVGASPRW